MPCDNYGRRLSCKYKTFYKMRKENLFISSNEYILILFSIFISGKCFYIYLLIMKYYEINHINKSFIYLNNHVFMNLVYILRVN